MLGDLGEIGDDVLHDAARLPWTKTALKPHHRLPGLLRRIAAINAMAQWHHIGCDGARTGRRGQWNPMIISQCQSKKPLLASASRTGKSPILQHELTFMRSKRCWQPMLASLTMSIVELGVAGYLIWVHGLTQAASGIVGIFLGARPGTPHRSDGVFLRSIRQSLRRVDPLARLLAFRASPGVEGFWVAFASCPLFRIYAVCMRCPIDFLLRMGGLSLCLGGLTTFGIDHVFPGCISGTALSRDHVLMDDASLTGSLSIAAFAYMPIAIFIMATFFKIFQRLFGMTKAADTRFHA